MFDRILVVDDEPLVLEVLSEVLASEGFQVAQAPHGTLALELLDREPFELLLCDIRMPGMDGFELLKEVRRCHPGIDVIMMTGFGSLDGAVEAMTLGAADYLIKPLKPKEIVARIRSILQRRKLEAELHSLQSELRSRFEPHNLVAVSPRMRAVVSALKRISGSEEPLALCGEPGTGRRFVARAVHYASPRREQEFRCVDCASAPQIGFASLLFGERQPGGRLQRGELERLRAGTLHLFQVEKLPIDVQRRLGRALASGRYERDGEEDGHPLEARLLVSTSTPVSELLASGALAPEMAPLREHLVIHLPSLRQRIEDLPGLVQAFVQEFAVEQGQTLRVPPESIELLARESFPGNVAQLFVVLTHGAKLSLDGTLTPEIVARSMRQASVVSNATPKPISDHLGDREYQLVLHAVQRHPGRLDEAARELGVSRTTLWRRMRKYGIRVPAS